MCCITEGPPVISRLDMMCITVCHQAAAAHIEQLSQGPHSWEWDRCISLEVQMVGYTRPMRLELAAQSLHAERDVNEISTRWCL